MSSYAQTPRDHQSACHEYPLRPHTSGAIYASEPATEVCCRDDEKCIATLKSVICAWPIMSKRMLSGLMSLGRDLSCASARLNKWLTDALCAACGDKIKHKIVPLSKI